MLKNITNPKLAELIERLKRTKIKHYKSIIKYLSKPARTRPKINLSRIDRVCNTDDKIVVPGKVLGNGELSKKLTIYAWQFSNSAIDKIKKADGKTLEIDDLIKSKVKTKIVI